MGGEENRRHRPLTLPLAADIPYRREPSGGTDYFDEHRKRRIADQILFVPRAARRQRDRTIEQPRHLQRNRKFVDSPLEGDGFELLVTPRRNSPRARHVVPRTAPPAWRGTHPERDEEFESNSRESANLRFLRPPLPRGETRSGIGRTRGIDGSNLGEAAKLESAKRAEELAADGDLASVAVGLRIIDATGPLAITTPGGPVH